MYDPEYYVGAWRVPEGAWVTCKYADDACVPPGAETVLWERRVFRLVPVPGEAGWAAPARGVWPEVKEGAHAERRADKRPRADEEMADADEAPACAGEEAAKRPKAGGNGDAHGDATSPFGATQPPASLLLKARAVLLPLVYPPLSPDYHLLSHFSFFFLSPPPSCTAPPRRACASTRCSTRRRCCPRRCRPALCSARPSRCRPCPRRPAPRNHPPSSS